MAKLVVNRRILFHPCSGDMFFSFFFFILFFSPIQYLVFFFPFLEKKSLLIHFLPASFFSSKLTFLSSHHSPQGVYVHVSRQKDYVDPHVRTVVFICTFHHFSCPSRKANPVLMAYWQVHSQRQTPVRQTSLTQFYLTLVFFRCFIKVSLLRFN